MKEVDPLYDEGKDSLMKLFDESEIGYFKRLGNMVVGLSKSPDSRQYKEARIELQRLSAPLAAVFLPLVMIILLVILSAVVPTKEAVIVTEVLDAVEVKDLDKIEPPEPPPPPDEVQITTDFTGPAVDTAVDTTTQTTDVSAQPQAFDAVAITKSPVVLKNLYGHRTPGSIGAKLRAGGGDAQTEAAVMASLRWLKYNQKPNGAFPAKSSAQAMTALGVLAFLAHGERPGAAECEEFGETVQKAVQYLIDVGSRKNDGNGYALAMQAYALSEAYGMTRNPNVGTAAAKAIELIVKGQHETGGWQYAMANPDPRDDLSLGGWCAQALKAAHLAHLT